MTAPEQTAEAPEAVEVEAPEPFDEARAMEKIKKANSEAEGLRRRLKELEPLATKAQQLEDAQKSETEKLTERSSAAENRATTAEMSAMRLEVALDKGLTKTQAKRLVGSSLEELSADADDLLASFTPAKPATPTGRPSERLRGGGDPTADLPPDPEKTADAIRRR